MKEIRVGSTFSTVLSSVPSWRRSASLFITLVALFMTPTEGRKTLEETMANRSHQSSTPSNENTQSQTSSSGKPSVSTPVVMDKQFEWRSGKNYWELHMTPPAL